MSSNHNNKSCIACMIQNIRLWKVDVLLHKKKNLVFRVSRASMLLICQCSSFWFPDMKS